MEDVNERFGKMTIWEYNRKHNTNFGLDDVYGKGYTDALSQDEKDICELKSRMADIEDGTPNNEYTTLCEEFIKARYDNTFRQFVDNYLSDDIALVLYDKQIIVGKEDFCRYWKEWMQSLKREGIGLNSVIKQGNYVGHPIIEDKISGYRNMYLTFVVKKGVIICAIFQPIEEWLDKLPLSYKPLWFGRNISLGPQSNRMPCPVCGTLSESLEWNRALCACGGEENDADVSMCPQCHRIVEVEMELLICIAVKW